MPNAREQELVDDGYHVHQWSNAANYWYPVHEHPYHKAIIVMKGSITFYLPKEKEEVVLSEGNRLEIPAHTDHSATVGAHGVTCLEGQRRAE